MSLELYKIYLSTDNKEVECEAMDGNVDVIVLLNNNKKYIASFFSYANIIELSDQHRKEKSYLNGNFFWNKNMVLVKSINKQLITCVVNHLLHEGEFMDAFKQISK